MGWEHSSDRTTGGRQPLPLRGFCAKCRRPFDVDQMREESYHESAAYGFLVCERCYDGAFPDPKHDIRNDDMGRINNVL